MNSNCVADYDSIATKYQESKQLPIRKAIDDYTVATYLGEMKNLSFLDLACGEGHYSRMFADHGAHSVTGVDLSSEMIAEANEKEISLQSSSAKTSIRYLQGDATSLPENLGQFDRVTGIFLLHYAKDEAQLSSMLCGIYHHLKPAGKFFAINENPDFMNKENEQLFRKYGYTSLYSPDGSQFTVSFYDSKGDNFSITGYHYPKSLYLRCFENAGFEDIQFLPMLLDPVVAAQDTTQYWDEFLSNQPVTAILATKPV